MITAGIIVFLVGIVLALAACVVAIANPWAGDRGLGLILGLGAVLAVVGLVITVFATASKVM